MFSDWMIKLGAFLASMLALVAGIKLLQKEAADNRENEIKLENAEAQLEAIDVKKEAVHEVDDFTRDDYINKLQD